MTDRPREESMDLPEDASSAQSRHLSSESTAIGRRFLEAEIQNIPMFFWALLVGSMAGFVGAIFRIFLVEMTLWREALVDWAQHFSILSWLLPITFSAVLVYAAILLVRKFAPEAGGSGVQEIEGALDEVRPVRWKRVLPVKFVGGLLSLGGGLVLGREGPTIQMGGNIGQMIGEWFQVSRDEVHTLVAAGAGAGLSAAFNAPLAGILFVLEEMRPQFRYNFVSVQCVLIAVAVSDIVVRMLTSQGPVVAMSDFPSPPLSSLWLFLIFGALFGLFGFVFNRLLVATLNFFAGLRGWSYVLTGLYVGAFIGFLGWLFPDTIGGGYEVISQALGSKIPIATLLILFIARYGTTVLSYGSGAPGGIFAPMMALGTLFGMWFGHVAHVWFPGLVAHPGIFAVAGMGALFSATVGAPLTGIALAIEMTGNYQEILPLILTCMVATIVAHGLGGRPIYTVLLQRTLDLAKKATSH
ncbi:MAG: H(+)/Cl(-) exchange transporter ClcA [Nitrospirales bacterium]